MDLKVATELTRLLTALGSIASFSAKLGITGIDIGVTLSQGRADSGSIEVNLEELVEDLSEALAEKRSGLVFVIDEMQDLDAGLIAALLSVQHLANQREWPFYIAGAGLPNLPSLLSESRSYAERPFSYTPSGKRPPKRPSLWAMRRSLWRSGRQQLDQGFFPSRWERASKAAKTFLHHMAVDGDARSVLRSWPSGPRKSRAT